MKYFSYLLLFFISGFMFWPTLQTFLEPEPYSNVEEVYTNFEEDSVELAYTFVKNGECEIKSFAVIGIGILPDYLKYEDLGDLPDVDGLYNREAGLQGLHIRVDTESYNTVEIRTRHLCGNKTIEKIFAIVERPDETSPEETKDLG